MQCRETDDNVELVEVEPPVVQGDVVNDRDCISCCRDMNSADSFDDYELDTCFVSVSFLFFSKGVSHLNVNRRTVKIEFSHLV